MWIKSFPLDSKYCEIMKRKEWKHDVTSYNVHTHKKKILWRFTGSRRQMTPMQPSLRRTEVNLPYKVTMIPEDKDTMAWQNVSTRKRCHDEEYRKNRCLIPACLWRSRITKHCILILMSEEEIHILTTTNKELLCIEEMEIRYHVKDG